jgi:hypothetical protein
MSFGQRGPSWGGPGAPGQIPHEKQTPDWAALADAAAARARRKKWLLIGGVALATCAVMAIVATAVVLKNGGDDTSATGTNTNDPSGADRPPAGAAASGPSSVTPPNAKDFISSASKDTAPLTADTLFPAVQLTARDRVYQKGPTALASDCATAAQKSLIPTLTSNGCEEVIRATYSKDGIAVTVGVAVFPEEAQALKAKSEAHDPIASLSGSGVPTFCRAGAICRVTSNSYGRYAYFTVGGHLDGKDVVKTDKDVFAFGDDVAEFTFRQILQRAQAQAAAARP